MNRDEKFLLSLLVVVAILGPVTLGVALHWAIWQWAALIVAALGIVLLISRRLSYLREQRELRAELAAAHAPRHAAEDRVTERSTELVRPVTTPPAATLTTPPAAAAVASTTPPQSYAAAPLSGISLPSALPDYRFVFSATVHWRPAAGTVGPPHASLPAVANNTIIARACEITAAEHPSEHSMVQHKLNAALGVVLPDLHRRVEAWAVQVSLTLPATDGERLRKLSEVRKDEEVWEHERSHERNKRAYLAEDVLKTPGSAVVWWLARNPDSIRETVGLIGILAQLSAAANDTEIPELFRPMVEHPADPPVYQASTVLADQLSRLLTTNDQDVGRLERNTAQPTAPEPRNGSGEPALWRPPGSIERSRT